MAGAVVRLRAGTDEALLGDDSTALIGRLRKTAFRPGDLTGAPDDLGTAVTLGWRAPQWPPPVLPVARRC